MPDFFFNELSLPEPVDAIPLEEQKLRAKQIMSAFVLAFVLARRSGWGEKLVTSEDFNTLQLCPDYSITDWLLDKAVDHDQRKYLNKKVTEYPYLNNATELQKNIALEVEAFFDGRSGLGLLAAHVLKGISASLPSHPSWNVIRLDIALSSLSPDGKLTDSTTYLKHFSNSETWKLLEDELIKEATAAISNGDSLLLCASTLLPHLEFCGAAMEQLAALSGSERHFRWVVTSLFKAETECAAWHGTSFPHYKLPGPASGEGERVHNNSVLRAARIFKDSFGQLQMFEFHMKHLTENQRIHYLPDGRRHKLMIAYVGDHLPL